MTRQHSYANIWQVLALDLAIAFPIAAIVVLKIDQTNPRNSTLDPWQIWASQCAPEFFQSQPVTSKTPENVTVWFSSICKLPLKVSLNRTCIFCEPLHYTASTCHSNKPVPLIMRGIGDRSTCLNKSVPRAGLLLYLDFACHKLSLKRDRSATNHQPWPNMAKPCKPCWSMLTELDQYQVTCHPAALPSSLFPATLAALQGTYRIVDGSSVEFLGTALDTWCS